VRAIMMRGVLFAMILSATGSSRSRDTHAIVQVSVSLQRVFHPHQW
jgi:hypothetical protein